MFHTTNEQVNAAENELFYFPRPYTPTNDGDGDGCNFNGARPPTSCHVSMRSTSADSQYVLVRTIINVLPDMNFPWWNLILAVFAPHTCSHNYTKVHRGISELTTPQSFTKFYTPLKPSMKQLVNSS